MAAYDWQAWRKSLSVPDVLGLTTRASLRVLPLLDEREDLVAELHRCHAALEKARYPETSRDLTSDYARMKALVEAALMGQDEEDIAAYADMTAMREGASVEDLLASPLWPDEEPGWLRGFWARAARMVQEREALDEDWSFDPVAWYEGLLNGA